MSQPLNDRQIRQRLSEATALAKEGKYQKASYLLHEIRDNPKAKRLLTQMEGRSDRIQVTDFFSGTVLAMIAFAVVVVIMIGITISGILGEFADRDAVYAEFPARNLVGNQELYVDLVGFCRENIGSDSATCLDWAELVFTNHLQQIRSCVVVNNDGFIVDDINRATITTCFSEVGIPNPS